MLPELSQHLIEPIVVDTPSPTCIKANNNNNNNNSPTHVELVDNRPQPDCVRESPTGSASGNAANDHPSPSASTSTSSLPPYIPFYDENNKNQSRTLVVCFDGTGDQFDTDNSNIVQLVSMLKKDDKTKQMVYYQAGIGTYISISPVVATPFMSKLSKSLDEMFAWNLDAHVMGGYEFLMQNYIAGDKICIFGFSRGAYTAQSLAGMIHKVGLLPTDNHQQVPFAYKMYTRTDSVGWDQSNAFKKAFSVDVKIEFLGVWDTIASVGLIPKRLPFTASNTIVKTFRHAIALDERRAKFKANLWNRPTKEEQQLGIHTRQAGYEKIRHRISTLKDDPHKGNDGENENNEHKHSKIHLHRGTTLWTLDPKTDRIMNCYENMFSDQSDTPTDVEEVWFAGCHTDVGGGSVRNGTRYSLARIPLRWMVRECFKAKSGVLFSTECLREIGLDPASLYPFVAPRPPPLLDHAKTRVIERPLPSKVSMWASGLFATSSSKAKKKNKKNKKAGTAEEEKEEQERRRGSGSIRRRTTAFISEEDEELRDALSPKYDQLKLKPFWWALELLPVSMRYQRGDDQWVSYIGINMGKPRMIPKRHDESGVKVHRSVKLRMEAQSLRSNRYQPKAKLRTEPTWVD